MAVTQQHIDKAIELAKEYGATKVLLFGSALSDPENANDLDIGVFGISDEHFFQFGGTLDIELGFNVDVIPLKQNSPFVDYIIKHGKYIYGS
jgi:predicted nucleotidyltransferase